MCFLLIGSCIGVCYLIEFVWPWKAQRTRTCSRVHNHHPGQERFPEPSTMSFLQVPEATHDFPSFWGKLKSRSGWWTGKPGMPQSMGSQRHDWVAELTQEQNSNFMIYTQSAVQEPQLCSQEVTSCFCPTIAESRGSKPLSTNPAVNVFQLKFLCSRTSRAVFCGGWTLAILSRALLKHNSSEAFVLCSQSVVWPLIHYIKLWVLAWQKKYYFFIIFFLKIFLFLMWTIFEVFIQLVTVLFLFPVLLFWLRGLWNLSSPTRDGICTPCLGRRSPKHWTTREVPGKKS